jgi:hypothetical protein
LFGEPEILLFIAGPHTPDQTIRSRPKVNGSNILEMTEVRFLAYGHFGDKNNIVQVRLRQIT